MCLFTLLISVFWLTRQIKAILFWLYLWQLKEYHIGRFLAHFQTEKGKKLIINWLTVIKIIILLLVLAEFDFSFYLLLLLYVGESLKLLKDFFQKKLMRPIFTLKTVFLISVGFLAQLLFLSFISFRSQNIIDFSSWVLFFDIFVPVILSVIVLIFQPIATIARWQLIQKAKEKRKKYKNLLVIGITGSYGKTSTKEFLAEILSQKFKVLKTKKHQNSEVGISQCILNNLNETHEIFVAEMGAYNKGGIKLLCDITRPSIGIVTGVNEQHLATFGSMKNLLSAEGGIELIDSLPSDGSAFFNAKNNYCLELYKRTKIKKFLYGENAAFLGQENILGAIMVAKKLGMTDGEISPVAKEIRDQFPGIEMKKGQNGLNIIDATYSANPSSVIAHLEYLKRFPGKKIILMTCLIELGSLAREIHKRIGEKIAKVCDLAIITTKDYFKELKNGAVVSGMPKENILFLEDAQKIIKKLRHFTKQKDTVLLESRVPKKVIDSLTL